MMTEVDLHNAHTLLSEDCPYHSDDHPREEYYVCVNHMAPSVLHTLACQLLGEVYRLRDLVGGK